MYSEIITCFTEMSLNNNMFWIFFFVVENCRQSRLQIHSRNYLSTWVSLIYFRSHVFHKRLPLHLYLRQCQVCNVMSRYPMAGGFGQIVHELLIEILWKTVYSNFDSHQPISSQFCTCHDSWAVVTWAKLWPDTIIIVCAKIMGFFFKIWIISSQSISETVPLSSIMPS